MKSHVFCLGHVSVRTTCERMRRMPVHHQNEKLIGRKTDQRRGEEGGDEGTEDIGSQAARGVRSIGAMTRQHLTEAAQTNQAHFSQR